MAKNLKLSEARGISTRFASQTGFPLSVLSASASSSKRSVIRLDTLSMCWERSSRVSADQLGNADLAASTACSTSVASESGISE